MGSPDFAVPSLKALHQAGHEIALVVSNPDKRRSRNGSPEPTPVKQYAIDHQIDYFDAIELKDPSFIDKIRSKKADLIVVVAFRILPPVVLEQAQKGAVNLHASLLPKYRGAAPIHHAILNGETETGCTIFRLNEKMDAGQMIAKVHVPIGPNDTTGDLYQTLSDEGASLLVKAVALLEKDEVTYTLQDESQASPAPKVFAEDGHLDFTQLAQKVHNRTRAMTPFPGAWVSYLGHGKDEKLLIHRTLVIDLSSTDHLQSTVISISVGELRFDGERKKLLLGCAAGTTLALEEVQLPGRSRITGVEFAKSNMLGIGVVQ